MDIVILELPSFVDVSAVSMFPCQD